MNDMHEPARSESTDHSALTIREGFRVKQVQGKLVAVDTVSGDYHVFNEVGALIWRGLADGLSRESILRQMVSTFEVSRERAAADADSFLADLRSRGLVR